MGTALGGPLGRAVTSTGPAALAESRAPPVPRQASLRAAGPAQPLPAARTEIPGSGAALGPRPQRAGAERAAAAGGRAGAAAAPRRWLRGRAGPGRAGPGLPRRPRPWRAAPQPFGERAPAPPAASSPAPTREFSTSGSKDENGVSLCLISHRARVAWRAGLGLICRPNKAARLFMAVA